MFTVHFAIRANQELDKIPDEYRNRIRAAAAALAKDPFLGKKLKGKYKGDYSLRIWPYRIFYGIDKKNKRVLIESARHRQGAY